MGLTSGTKLGPYEIRSSLGAGGMGEVYRAVDTRLGRIVAIKILPESFAKDTERLQRFEHVMRGLIGSSASEAVRHKIGGTWMLTCKEHFGRLQEDLTFSFANCT